MQKHNKQAMSIFLALMITAQFSAPLSVNAAESFTNVLSKEKISGGVSYTEEDVTNYYNTGTRQRINKLDVNLSDGYTSIIVGKGLDTAKGTETVGSQAQREALRGNNVIAGVNGDFYDMQTGIPNGIVVKDSKVVLSNDPDDAAVTANPSFYIDKNNNAGIGSLRCMGTIKSGTEYSVTDGMLNKSQGIVNGTVLFTRDLTSSHELYHDYGISSYADFVIIKLKDFDGIVPGQEYTGDVIEKCASENFPIPEGCVALAGYGTGQSGVAALQVGAKITFTYNLYVGEAKTLKNDITAALNFNTWMVKDGKVVDAADMKNPYIEGDAFYTGANARTALGIKEDGSIVVVTVDKPTNSFTASTGLSLPDLGKYMKDQGCVNALNLDGGGSTEMIVKKAGSTSPVTVNHPGDGNSRSVSDSLLFVSTAPKTGSIANVVVDKNISIYKGSSYSFSYRVTDQYGNTVNNAPTDVQWSTNVGTIDKKGKLTVPNQAGIGEVTATVNGVKGSAKVNVVDTFSTVVFTASEVVMQQNETIQFEFNACDAFGNQVIVDPASAQWSVTGDIGTVKNGLFIATAASGNGSITAIIGGQTVTTTISVGLKEQIIDDFETYPIEGYHLSGSGYGSAQYSNDGSTMLSISTDVKHSGSKSFKMDYDYSKWTRELNGTLNWVPHWYQDSDPKYWTDELAAQMDSTYKTEIYPKKFGMWVYGDGKAPWLNGVFKCGPDGNQSNKYLTLADSINWVGWKYVEVDIPQGWEMPIRLNYLYCVETNKSVPDYSGSIYFDDMKFLYTNDVTDVSGPEFSSVTPSSTNIYSSTIDFSTVVTDNLSKVDKSKLTVKVNDQPQAYSYDEVTGKLSFKLENLAAGDYKVFVEAYDTIGNQSIPWIEKTYHVDLSPDTEAPVLTDVTPTAAVAVKVSTPRITFKLKDQKSSVDTKSIVVKLGTDILPVYYDASTGWGYAEPEKSLADGSYQLNINAKDAVGNAITTYTDTITVAAIAQPKDANNFSISVIPDTQGNAFTERIFKRAAADDTSLVMHLGDIVDDGSQTQYDQAADFAKLFGSKPFFVLAGNHEAFKDTLDIFYQKFGSPTQHFEYGNTLIIMLNSAYGQSISASDSTQFHYLEEVLSKNTKKNVLVFNHVITKDDFGTAHEMSTSDRQKFESILSAYKSKNSDVTIDVLFGHLHTLQTWSVGGVNYIIGGNAADKAYVSNEQGNLLGSGKITVANGRMTYSYDPLLTKVYIKNDAIIKGEMNAVVGSHVQLDLYGDFRESPSQYMTQLNSHKLVGITWTSSNPNAVSVNAKGILTSNGVGTATITATSGGKSHSITVKAVDPASVKPVKLQLNVSNSVQVGESVLPTVIATDAYNATYALNIKDVAVTVKHKHMEQQKDGSLLAKTVGDDEITVQFSGLSASAKILVVPKEEIPSEPDNNPPSGGTDSSGANGTDDIGTDDNAKGDKGNNTQDIVKTENIQNTPTEVKVDLTKGSTKVSVAQMSQLLEDNKTKPVVLSGSNYTITFPAGTMQAVSGQTSFDFGVSFNVGTSYPKIKELSGNSMALMIDFNYSGQLPAEATITIQVGTQYAGKTLYYYYYNTTTGALEFMQSAVVAADGTVTVKQSHCSSYVLLTAKTSDTAAKPSTTSNATNPTSNPKTGERSFFDSLLYDLAQFCKNVVAPFTIQ